MTAPFPVGQAVSARPAVRRSVWGGIALGVGLVPWLVLLAVFLLRPG